MSEYNARIEHWYREQVTKKEFILWGKIYEDKWERWPDGHWFHTSGIKNRELKPGDIVQTRNNRYLLGKEQLPGVDK